MEDNVRRSGEHDNTRSPEERYMKNHHMRSPFWRTPGGIITAVFFGIITAVVFAFVFGYFVMLLWNWLMPVLFHLGTINFWQAFGIALLSRLLFGSFGGHHGGKRYHHKHHYHGMQMGWDGHDRGEWEPKNGWHDWKYYKDYWREEGKEAFEKYVEKLREANKNGQPKDRE